MMKKLICSLLAVVLVLGCCTVALAADTKDSVYVKTLDTTIDSITVGVYAAPEAALKNGKIVFTYPDTLKLVSAEGKLPEESGISDLDTSKAGTISFAWASYKAQEDVELLELKFEGKTGEYKVQIALPETGETIETVVEIPYLFLDVQDKTEWYFDAVYGAYQDGLMNGVGEDLFAPNKTLTRGMFATILYRMAGSPKVEGKAPFTDVAAGLWYTDAVIWASKNGVVNGYGKQLFAPNKEVNRQEMATMLYRYWRLQGGQGTPSSVEFESFVDKDQVAGWAQEAMKWATARGVINGVGGNRLSPKGTATRAQVAQILMNYKNTD